MFHAYNLLYRKTARSLSTFDAHLIFAKASYADRKSIRTLKYQHTEITKQVITAITRTENGNCLTEADMDAIFGNRQHSSNSESYYWEQTYHIFDCKEVIPIDSYGQAHIFPQSHGNMLHFKACQSQMLMLSQIQM